MATTTAEQNCQFDNAVKLITNLPKDGSFQPSNELKLLFYSYFKQATVGPCAEAKPKFWDVVKRAKWDAWKALGDMSKREAMLKYIETLRQVVETMSYSEEVRNFLVQLNDSSTFDDDETHKIPNGSLPKINGFNEQDERHFKSCSDVSVRLTKDLAASEDELYADAPADVEVFTKENDEKCQAESGIAESLSSENNTEQTEFCQINFSLPSKSSSTELISGDQQQQQPKGQQQQQHDSDPLPPSQERISKRGKKRRSLFSDQNKNCSRVERIGFTLRQLSDEMSNVANGNAAAEVSNKNGAGDKGGSFALHFHLSDRERKILSRWNPKVKSKQRRCHRTSRGSRGGGQDACSSTSHHDQNQNDTTVANCGGVTETGEGRDRTRNLGSYRNQNVGRNSSGSESTSHDDSLSSSEWDPRVGAVLLRMHRDLQFISSQIESMQNTLWSQQQLINKLFLDNKSTYRQNSKYTWMALTFVTLWPVVVNLLLRYLKRKAVRQ